VIPVVKHTGRRIALTLRAGGRGGGNTRERLRARNGLVVAQVALALVLLVGSGLMIRTFVALRDVQPGFLDPRHVQLVRVTIPDALVADPQRVILMQREMRDRLAAIPGVREVSFTANVPMAGERTRWSVWRDDNDAEGSPPMRWIRFVAPGYFHTIGTPLVAGRDLSQSDIDAGKPVAIISENLAREFWKSPAAAVGHRIRESGTSPWREIVGVVGDVYDDGVHRPAPAIVYWPWAMPQYYGTSGITVQRAVTFAMRTDRAGTARLLSDAQEAIASVSRDVPLTRVRTLGDVYSRSLAPTSFTLVALVVAAAMALFLGLVGIYGVVAYAVTQRRREIGIRLALGAPHRDVRRMFVRQGAELAAIGAVCGLLGALVVTRLMAGLLFGTSSVDPMTYLLVALGLVGVAALASYVPARTASRVDPLRSLRGE
jgi:predicted permease